MAATDPANEQWRPKRTLRYSVASLMFIVLCVAGVHVGARVGQQRLRLSPVQDNLGSDLIAPANVRERDVVSFQLRGQTYHVRVARLVNNLIGQDFGVLDVSTKRPSP